MGEDQATSRCTEQRLLLLQEMRVQNFDLIRFASYRTSCKLRFVQKKLNLHLVDIWNVIESFRENGLNTVEPNSELNVTRLETLVSSLYHNLNKRLPSAQQISVEMHSSLLLNWLLTAYSCENLGRIRVFSIKVALATLCSGKLMDKLRYIFSQLCDANGYLVVAKWTNYLKQVLALPASVYESPSFPFKDELAKEIFAGNGKVTVNDFMDTIMSDPGPSSLVWLPLLHRLASVESVVHSTVCDACHRENYCGFRYKCTKCSSFQMCQDCFWRGRVVGSHTLHHQVKEYSTYKSPSKQIGHSLRKSFRCVPDKANKSLPRFPDTPEKPLNLSHIVPPSPIPSHNGFPEYVGNNYDMGTIDSRCSLQSPGRSAQMKIDDEHKLIARYAARLAEVQSGRSPTDYSLGIDTSQAQRDLITQLEMKNREIMREIARLRIEQEMTEESPGLVCELRALRQRKEELETHLATLQDSRKHLMLQLETLMKLLKNHQASPRSTPNSSPRSSKSPPPSSRSAPPTPSNNPDMVGINDMRASFTGSTSIVVDNSLIEGEDGDNMERSGVGNDLLEAADSVTNAMSSLVRELNSDGAVVKVESNPKAGNKYQDFEGARYEDRLDGSWKEESKIMDVQYNQLVTGSLPRRLDGEWEERFSMNR